MVLVELKTPTWLTHSAEAKLQVDFPILTRLDLSYLDHHMRGLGYASLKQASLLPDDRLSSPLWSLCSDFPYGDGGLWYPLRSF